MRDEGKGLFIDNFHLRNAKGLAKRQHQHFVISFRMGAQAVPLVEPKTTGHPVMVTEWTAGREGGQEQPLDPHTKGQAPTICFLLSGKRNNKKPITVCFSKAKKKGRNRREDPMSLNLI